MKIYVHYMHHNRVVNLPFDGPKFAKRTLAVTVSRRTVLQIGVLLISFEHSALLYAR